MSRVWDLGGYCRLAETDGRRCGETSACLLTAARTLCTGARPSAITPAPAELGEKNSLPGLGQRNVRVRAGFRSQSLLERLGVTGRDTRKPDRVTGAQKGRTAASSGAAFGFFLVLHSVTFTIHGFVTVTKQGTHHAALPHRTRGHDASTAQARATHTRLDRDHGPQPRRVDRAPVHYGPVSQLRRRARG